MNRTLLILSVVAGVGALGGGATVWWRPAKATEPGARAAAPNAVSAPHAPPSSPGTPPATTVRLAARIDAAQIQGRWSRWLEAPARDPFLILLPKTSGPLAPDSPVSRFQLLATWLQTGGRLAVIDRQVYAEGDALAEYRIVAIRPDAVVVQGRERREEITFTSYVPGGPTPASNRTNLLGQWLGPEKERVY